MTPPGNGLCIIFMYHKCDKLTLLHFELLQRSNPQAIIVPVVDSVPGMIPGTVDVGKFPSRWAGTTDLWKNCDTILYRWFENREVSADKYVVIEYDCLCTVDLKEYFKEVWDSDVAPVNMFTWPEDNHWYWFRELNKLDPTDQAFAAGIMPFTCCLLSHEALEKIIAITTQADVISELRLGTAVKRLGLKVKMMPNSIRNHIFWHLYPWRVKSPGLYHPIKWVNHNKIIPLFSLFWYYPPMFFKLERWAKRLTSLVSDLNNRKMVKEKEQ